MSAIAVRGTQKSMSFTARENSFLAVGSRAPSGSSAVRTTGSCAPMSCTEEHPIQILTAAELAKLLGVDRKTIYEAASRGDIPHRRLGRRLLFERGTS